MVRHAWKVDDHLERPAHSGGSDAEVMNEQDDPVRYRRGYVRPETTICDIGETLYNTGAGDTDPM